MIRKINDTNLRNFTDGNSYSVNGTTTQTITASVFIPGNTFQSGDFLNIDTAFFRNTTTSLFTSRFYYNSTLSLTGAIQIGIRLSVSSANSYVPISRTLSIRTADGTGAGISLGTEVIASGSNVTSEFVSSAVSNLPIDWTTDGYIFSSVVPSVSGLSISQYFLKVWTY